MFANFCVLNHVCHVCQRLAKYAISDDNLDQKYMTRGYVCQFGGPDNFGKHTLSSKYFLEIIFTHDFDLPRPLQTPFELKN